MTIKLRMTPRTPIITRQPKKNVKLSISISAVDSRYVLTDRRITI